MHVKRLASSTFLASHRAMALAVPFGRHHAVTGLRETKLRSESAPGCRIPGDVTGPVAAHRCSTAAFAAHGGANVAVAIASQCLLSKPVLSSIVSSKQHLLPWLPTCRGDFLRQAHTEPKPALCLCTGISMSVMIRRV